MQVLGQPFVLDNGRLPGVHVHLLEQVSDRGDCVLAAVWDRWAAGPGRASLSVWQSA